MYKRRLAAVLLLLCLFAQTMAHARSASITFDEGPHLAIGYATLRTGDLRLQPVHIHPPLANALAAAPLLLQTDLPDPRSAGGWDVASLSGVTDAVVWQYPHPRRMAIASRCPIILMTLLLGVVVLRWASDLFGPRAGLAALCLYAFDPNIVAHGSLVTTDMAVVLWGSAALFLTARYLRRSRFHRGYWAGVGIVLGLALASKVSAVSLLPPVGLLFLLGPQSLPWKRRFLAAVGCMALAALTLWAVYGFEVGYLPDLPLPIPAVTHLKIYRALQEHYQLGHPSFLMGQNGDHGWRHYFPVAFVLKTPLPTLLLLVAASIRACTSAIQRISEPTDLRTIARRWGPLAIYPLLYAASSLFSSVNIGYRHLLPTLPFLFIFISRMANDASRFTFRVLRFAFYALLACCPIVALRIAPNYLAYFNLLAGGPAEGYRYLVDSNLDWGQNMWQLRDWMAQRDVERVYYAHFSPDRPQVYGIQADFLPPDPRAVPFAPLDPAPGVYAIGATVLQGVYTPDVNTYAWFRTHEPAAKLGHALFVYEAPERASPTWAAVCADPAPALSAREVRAGFGNADMRVIVLDCGQSWVYPAGDEPGAYVLSPDVDPPPGAELDVAARHSDGNSFYNMYRVYDASVIPQGGMESPLEDVTTDGPLTPIKYWGGSGGAYPGDTMALWTWWRVKRVPDRPLSLMCHLVGADGSPIAVMDGLGVPVEQWQPEDIIVQRCSFQVSEETPPGAYRFHIGAYWLDTLERWPIQMQDGTVSDRIVSLSVAVSH